jgi:hypothetical protein
MSTYHERLGVSPDATPARIKAAYHAKLKEYPAHSHPDEFKAIRAAYEAIRRGDIPPEEDFFRSAPFDVTIDPDLVKSLRERIIGRLTIDIEELIRETY